jgi:hypothetical protein
MSRVLTRIAVKARSRSGTYMVAAAVDAMQATPEVPICESNQAEWIRTTRRVKIL